MRLIVDSATCQGYGLCHEEAPQLVDLDDGGYSVILGTGDVSADQRAAAESAVETCPVKALRLAP